jgi:hypothetical protein
MRTRRGPKCRIDIRETHGKSLIGIISGLGKKVRKCRCGKGLSFNDKTLCKKCSMM